MPSPEPTPGKQDGSLKWIQQMKAKWALQEQDIVSDSDDSCKSVPFEAPIPEPAIKLVEVEPIPIVEKPVVKKEVKPIAFDAPPETMNKWQKDRQ